MDKDLLFRLSVFFKENYESISELSVADVIGIVKLFDENIFFVEEHGAIKFLALYLKVNDETLELIKKYPYLLKDEQVLVSFIKSDGDNVHFVAAVGDNRHLKAGIVEVYQREEPKSISWYKPSMDKFHNIKIGGRSCHQYSQLSRQ